MRRRLITSLYLLWAGSLIVGIGLAVAAFRGEFHLSANSFSFNLGFASDGPVGLKGILTLIALGVGGLLVTRWAAERWE